MDLDAALERLIALVDQRVDAHSVIAMNGSSNGGSNSGNRVGLVDQRRQQLGVIGESPTASPSPAASLPASSRTNLRWQAAVFRLMPVVSSSSPPDRNGVGSSSSEM